VLRLHAVRLVSLRTVCRVVALILLCLTALDLGVPSLCALDSEGLPPGSSAPTCAILVASAATAPRPDLPTQPAVHVDDCFCCSGCVQAQPVFHIAPVVQRSPELHVLPNSHVPLLSTHFFHPPQLLS
jgi:hypothetical protein